MRVTKYCPVLFLGNASLCPGIVAEPAGEVPVTCNSKINIFGLSFFPRGEKSWSEHWWESGWEAKDLGKITSLACILTYSSGKCDKLTTIPYSSSIDLLLYASFIVISWVTSSD